MKQKFFQILKRVCQYLKQENQIIYEQQMKIVRKFRTIKKCPLIFQTLKEHSINSKINRDKDVYKNKIWGKVQMWLKEYDEKDQSENEEDKIKDENINNKNLADANKSNLLQIQNVDTYSFLSKDMFDEKFENTKDELFSTNDYNTMILNNKSVNNGHRMAKNGNMSRMEELCSNASVNNTLDVFDKELKHIMKMQ